MNRTLHPPLDPGCFDHLKPTNHQIKTMEYLRAAAKQYATVLEALLPDGSDKTYVLRKLRTVAMWANVTVTRHADGTPRTEQDP